MAAVRADRLDPGRELIDHGIDEVDRAGLSMARVDLQCADPRRIVDRGVLVASHWATLFRFSVKNFTSTSTG